MEITLAANQIINWQKRGGISIIGILLFGLLTIFVLSYFHISIQAVVQSPDTQSNLQYVGGGTVSIWNQYLKGPATYLWDNVWVPLFWQPFVANMENIRNNMNTNVQNSAPTVNINNNGQ